MITAPLPSEQVSLAVTNGIKAHLKKLDEDGPGFHKRLTAGACEIRLSIRRRKEDRKTVVSWTAYLKWAQEMTRGQVVLEDPDQVQLFR